VPIVLECAVKFIYAELEWMESSGCGLVKSNMQFNWKNLRKRGKMCCNLDMKLITDRAICRIDFLRYLTTMTEL
jgi:hypothetical protein